MKGVELLESAETIVTFNEFNSDMPELERWYENETGKSLCLNADPIDMLMLVYGAFIESLYDLYKYNWPLETLPVYEDLDLANRDDKYVCSQRYDVFATYKIWDAFNQCKLRCAYFDRELYLQDPDCYRS